MNKLTFIEATDLGDAWFQALDKVMTGGRRYLITSGSYEGIHRSALPLVINIKYPGTRPLAPQMPEGSNIPPPTTEEDIEEYLGYLMTPVRQPGEHYTYGEDLYWQVEWVIKHYKEGGFGNNHGYMTVGRPETLYFYDRSVDYSEQIFISERSRGVVTQEYFRDNLWNKDSQNRPSSQCLRGIDTWIDEGKLHFWVYFRSWDLWGGFPVNLGGIQLLKEYMAESLEVADGAIVASCKDLHVYEHTDAVALMRLGKQKETTITA